MKIIIFADADGCASSIRGNCVQPVVGGSSAMNLDRAQSNTSRRCGRYELAD